MWTTRRFTGSQRNIWYPCVDDTPIHHVTIQHLVHVCGRHVHSPSHNSTFRTHVWTTVRIAKMASVCVVPETRWVTISHRSVRIGPFFNRTNEGKIHVNDFDFSFAHRDHQVRHTNPQGHKSTFCTFVWTTRRFTRV